MLSHGDMAVTDRDAEEEASTANDAGASTGVQHVNR